MNHLGRRGGHFQAALKEFATALVTKSAGCMLPAPKSFRHVPQWSLEESAEHMGSAFNMDSTEGPCGTISGRNGGVHV